MVTDGFQRLASGNMRCKKNNNKKTYIKLHR